MKNVGLSLIAFLAGVLLVFILNPKQNTKVAQIKIPPFSVSLPPSDSLRGVITDKTGSIYWESRVATMSEELKDNAVIEQGVRLITHEKSSLSLNFSKVGTIEILENAELSFAQTLPVDFVVNQKTGTVNYVLQGFTPLSVRVRGALIAKTTPGAMRIAVRESESIVLITTESGTAKIGYNDSENSSQVFTLKEGQVYEYNSDERTTINSKNK